MGRPDVRNICFHGIGTPERELEPGEDRYWVDTDRFLRILDEIARWPSVAISFDDGNASDARIGLPALVDRGLHGSFFLLAGRLGLPGSVGHDDVKHLVGSGMTIGTHGMSHRSWRRMDQRTRAAELIEARQQLAGAAGADVAHAACPLGRYDRALLADLRKLGYQRVYTSDRSIARPASWLQPRFSVRCEDTPESLREEILRQPGARKRSRDGLVRLAKRLR
jgi:peptidoglycan/xylan/chitin deacetylase (PgdA/CDA1 family)